MRLYLHATILDVEDWEPIWHVTTYSDGPTRVAAMRHALESLHGSLMEMYSPQEIRRLCLDVAFSEVPIASPVPLGTARRVPGMSWALATPPDPQ